MTTQILAFARLIALAFSCGLGIQAFAQSQPNAISTEQQGNLYAVEFRSGPHWDSSKQPHEQAYFREHSANLKRLRDQGNLVLGARYADKGFVILSTASKQEAHTLIQQDPSIQNRIFSYELHEFDVFYPGSVQPKKRRQ